ncbi:MAG: peroxidase-related enzyme [Pseudomonadota bacterium]
MQAPKTKGMTALELPPVDPLPDDIKRYYEVCEEKLGMIPNVLAVYAFEPERLRGFSAMYNALMLGESELTKAEREMIAVVVSSLNHCYYCLVAHGATLRMLTADPKLGEAIAANYRHADLTPRQRAMLDFAAKVTKSSADIVEADRRCLRDAGFSDRGIMDIAEVAGFFNMSNRVSSAIAMKPNDAYHGMAR